MLNKMMFFSLLALAFSVTANAEDLGGLKVGDKAPCVELTQINTDGTETTSCITAPSAGQKFVIINFMATDCGACNQELPAVSKLVSEVSSVASYKAIAIDRKSRETAMRNWVKAKSAAGLLNYPVALDLERAATPIYKIKYTPTTYIIDENGIIVDVSVGSIEESDIPVIKKILGM